jgi:hypothetical protein
VIAKQRDHVGRSLGSKPENAVDTPFRIWTTVDVVTQEHNCVLALQLDCKTTQQIVQGFPIAMDVTDRDSSHVRPSVSRSSSWCG